MVKTILRLEGLATFIASVYFYSIVSGNWFLFFALILVPDLAMLGYLRNKAFGSLVYNLLHNYVLGIAKILFGIYIANSLLVALGIILLAHVGMDRFLGFGLKYPTNFKHSHFQKV